MCICKSAKCSKYLFYMFLKSCPDIHLFNRILHERNTIKTFRKSCQFCPQCERRRSDEENVRSSKTVTSFDMRWIAVHVPHAIPHLLCYRAVGRPKNPRGWGVIMWWALYAPTIGWDTHHLELLSRISEIKSQVLKPTFLS